jgi:hypothetical protein
MSSGSLEERAHKAVLRIAEHVEDIDQKLTHFLENYRQDYYSALNGVNYKKALKQYKR